MKKDQAKKIRENEELWIDYLESEIEPSLKDDLDIQLAHCPEAQKLTQEYQALKSAIKKVDPAIHFNKEDYHDFHNKVINTVSHKSVYRSLRFLQYHRVQKLAAIAAVFLLVLGGLSVWNVSQIEVSDSAVDVATETGWLLETEDASQKAFDIEETENTEESDETENKDEENQDAATDILSE